VLDSDDVEPAVEADDSGAGLAGSCDDGVEVGVVNLGT